MTEENSVELTTIIAKSAIEIVQDCRKALDLPKGASLINAVCAVKATADRFEFLKDALERHEQITLTFDKRRDNYSADIQLGNLHADYYSSLNHIDAGDDRPSPGQLLDEAIDAAMNAASQAPIQARTRAEG